MKFLNDYKLELNLSNPDEVFNYLLSTLKESIRTWDYYVNWNKILKNIKEIEYDLNTLNYLIGKDDIEEEAKFLLKRNPNVLSVIPIVIASRDREFKVLDPKENDIFNCKHYHFKGKQNLTDKEVNEAVEFLSKVGFLRLFKDKLLKNVVDYVMGVEVGLDSNGRKNRSGTDMENLVHLFINNMAKKYGFEFITQATIMKIEKIWGLSVAVDKTDRHFDFAINNGNKLYLIEANYYSGSGSKLKATAGEYKALSDLVRSSGHNFIWITDGLGWHTAKAPLRETFNYTDYIFNLHMLEKSIFENVIVNSL